MNMGRTDMRIRYTKAVIRQALLEILEKKNITQITVKELCDRAGINRGTFYLHYSAPNDVLLEIEQQFVADNLKLYVPYINGNYEIDALSALFESILRNAELCRILMGPNGSPKFLNRIKEMMRDKILIRWKKEFPDYKVSHLEYVYDYIFAGSMSLILSWITQNDHADISVEELANRLDRLGHYCHLAIRDFN